MNQNPKQLSYNIIGADHIRCGWSVQPKTKINLNSGLVVAVSKFYPENNASDYDCFINKKLVSFILVNAAIAGVYQPIQKTQRRGYSKLTQLPKKENTGKNVLKTEDYLGKAAVNKIGLLQGGARKKILKKAK